MQESGLSTLQVNIDGETYYHMPIDVAIKYASKLKSGFFVPLSETKRVRIHLDDSGITEKMVTYREKGLSSILLAEDDYYQFIKEIKRGLISYFLKDDEHKTLSITAMLSLAKKVMQYMGIDEQAVGNASEIVEKVITQTKSVSVIYSPMKTFMRDNQDEFLKTLLVSYTAIGLIDKLNWTTPQIKEKIVQICLFSDITLTSSDITHMLLTSFNHKRYSRRILEHPLEAAKLVGKTRNAVGREVIKAIEQHQERPDGTGYPKQIKGLSITQLSAVQIVARTFIDKLVACEFAYDDRLELIHEILAGFNYNNFAQPSKALYTLLGLEPEEFESDYD